MAGEGAFHSSSFPSSSTFNDRDSRDDSFWHSSQFPTHRHDRDDDYHHSFHHYPYGGDFENRQFGDRFPRNRPPHGSNSHDDSRSCIFFIIAFCLFGPVTMIFGIYGPTELVLGPNSSILIQPNPIFVHTLKVESLNGTSPRPMIYEFYEVPSLDIINWTEKYNLSVAPNYHKERTYFLNAGSQVNISYQLRSHKSSLLLIIAKGREELNDWLNDPSRSSTTLSWNLIHDSGMITQEIYDSSSYYIAVGNLHEEVEVELHIRIGASVYNTTEAYRECALDWGSCSKDISFSGGNAAVLVSPGHNQRKSVDEWYVKLSYGPRWGTYIMGVGGMTLFIYLAFSLLNIFRHHREAIPQGENPETVSERGPLLSKKDDDVSSRGSSHNPISHDNELDCTGKASGEGKPHMDDEVSNKRLCAICFDAARDSFFLPCGHSVSCFTCGTRITEASGTCPVCRENISKIKKIFTV